MEGTNVSCLITVRFIIRLTILIFYLQNLANTTTGLTVGKKGRQRERRLMKGFNFDLLFMDNASNFEDDLEFDVGCPSKSKSSSSRSRFIRIAKGLSKRKGNRWRQLIEATRNKVLPFSRSQESMNSEAAGSSSVPADGQSQSQVAVDANFKRTIFARKSTSLITESSPNICTQTHASHPIEPTTQQSIQQSIAVKRHPRNEWI